MRWWACAGLALAPLVVAGCSGDPAALEVAPVTQCEVVDTKGTVYMAKDPDPLLAREQAYDACARDSEGLPPCTLRGCQEGW